MLGNWATGKLRIVRAPTSTMTMEITMETIGRLMKNFDIGSSLLGRAAKRLGVHSRTWAHLLDSFGDNSVSGMQPISNNPLRTDSIPHRDRSNVDFVVPTY